MEKNVKKNVRHIYTQQVLSGFSNIIQSTETSSDSPPDEQGRAQELPKEFWKQSSYKAAFSLIIEKIGNDSDVYNYRISLNDDTDISLSPVSKHSKKVSKQTFTIHSEEVSKNRSVFMVYGVHQKGVNSLSYSPEYPISKGITELYSFLLGQIDRTIECLIQQQKNQETNDDTGKHIESSHVQENVGNDKKARRRKKVLSKIRNETISKDTTKMDETDRSVLGGGSPDTGNKLGEMDNNTDDGKHFTDEPLEF